MLSHENWSKLILDYLIVDGYMSNISASEGTSHPSDCFDTLTGVPSVLQKAAASKQTNTIVHNHDP